MPTTLVLPDGFEWIALPLLVAQLLLTTQGVMVYNYRQKAKIEYPQLYAEKTEADSSPDAYKFNCMQRVHGNTLENITTVTVCTVLTALVYPTLASMTSGLWVFGRILYTMGYLEAPIMRNKRGGIIAGVSQTLLQITAIVSVTQLLGSKFFF